MSIEDPEYKKIFEHSPDAIICVNKMGIIINVNLRTNEIFLYEKEELMGKQIELLIPDRFTSGHDQLVQSYFKSPHKRAMGAGLNIIGLRKDKTEVELDIHLSFIDDFAVATIRDISDISKLKRENEINGQMGSLGILAAGMAHDVNNTLTIMSGCITLIQKNKGDLDKHINSIHNSWKRIAQIVSDLNNYSKSCSSDKEFQKINLKDVVELSFRLTAPEIKHSSRIKIETVDTYINGNSGKLVQVLINLIINAKQALNSTDMDENLISSRVYCDENMYGIIEITDNGVGIDQNKQNKIFEAFFTTKSASEGTGLGLSLARDIVESMGGEINVSSEENKGTTFKLKFQSL
jgi:protein-histidine pros-kinase